MSKLVLNGPPSHATQAEASLFLRQAAVGITTGPPPTMTATHDVETYNDTH